MKEFNLNGLEMITISTKTLAQKVHHKTANSEVGEGKERKETISCGKY